MMIRTAPLLPMLVLAACGGTPPPPGGPAPAVVVAPVKLDPPCPLTTVDLPDGHLRCRELPFELAFPPGTKLQRSSEANMTLFAATLEHGVLALVAEPRAEAPDAATLATLLGNLARGIAPDSTTSPIAAPALAGATVTAAIAFATPDGGAGVVRGYYAHHWMFALVAGGRLATTPTRPDMPVAQSFFSSLRIRPLPIATVKFELADGAHLTLPASAWSSSRSPAEPGIKLEQFMLIPERGMVLSIRELDGKAAPQGSASPGTACEYLAAATTDLESRFKTVYSSAQFPLSNIARGTYGELSVYAEAKTSATGQLTMYFICSGTTALQLSVVGEHPVRELRGYLDEIAKTLVGAR